MADLTAIASLATAGGTMVLGIATFASVRSANRAARVAERSLLAGLRPVLAPTRDSDPDQKISWGDSHWTQLRGGRAGVELTDDVIYLSMPLRNVGNGIAVLQGWYVHPDVLGVGDAHRPEDFTAQQRDLYVPSGDIGFWQGALRDPAVPLFGAVAAVIRERERFSIELLYSDHEGGQPTVTRFGMWPVGEDDWIYQVARHVRVGGS